MEERIERRGNQVIRWRNRDRRLVWDLDPASGAVVEFRVEAYKRHLGRYGWVSRREEAWSNPEYAASGGGVPWGMMTVCPELPE